jgi:hypothetical protein
MYFIMKHKVYVLHAFCFLFVCLPYLSRTQTVKEIEKDLLNSLQRIDEFAHLSKHTDETAFDSLTIENRLLKEKLTRYALQNTEMMSYDFPALKNYGFYKAVSPDKTFCIYSWDLQTGGSMHFFDNVYQYLQYGKLYVKTVEGEEGAPGGFYTEVFQLTDELNTFYMAVYHSILSGRDCYQAVHVFDFERENFYPKFEKIKTASRITHSLGFSYDFFSVAERKERPVKLISYNKVLQTISIPVVDAKGKVSTKKIIYKYDGDYFIRQSVSK